MKTFSEVYTELLKLNIINLTFKEELEFLYEQASNLNENSTIVELGSFCGCSSYVLGYAAKNSKSDLFCIDKFLQGFDGQPIVDAYSEWNRVMRPVHSDVKLLKTDTHFASKTLNIPVDFLFIDADHSYEGVKQDLEDWLPKVKSGGKVFFHDYTNTACAGVKLAVDEYTKDWSVIDLIFSLKGVIKPCQ